MSNRVDWFTLIARDRGMPEGWMWNSSRHIDGGFLVSGAVCTARFQRGPRKGAVNWSKRDRATEREIFISQADVIARQLRWERETGKCHVCQGSTLELAGWSARDGVSKQPCRRCNATGTAPESPPPGK